MHFEVLKDGVKINPAPYINADLYQEFETIPVKRNETVKQIEVKIDVLRVRSLPFGDILGFCTPGIYNVLESKENGGYTWYKIGENIWIAHSDEWSKVYDIKPAEDNVVKEPETIVDETMEDIVVADEQNNAVYENILLGIKNALKNIINSILMKIKDLFKNYFFIK